MESFVRWLFTRALQFALAGCAFGLIAVAVRGSPTSLASGVVLLALALCALRWRHGLLDLLSAHPCLALAFPVAPIVAVGIDGGLDSVWTPLVAITVGIPATLGRPRLILGCAVLAAAGQAAAAALGGGDASADRLVEAALFNAIGTVAAGLGLAMSVATFTGSLRLASEDLLAMRSGERLLGPGGNARAALPAPTEPQLPRLTPAELRVVAFLADGLAPKQVARELSVKLATVRSHIKSAKRKTCARTLPELVGMFVAEDGRL